MKYPTLALLLASTCLSVQTATAVTSIGMVSPQTTTLAKAQLPDRSLKGFDVSFPKDKMGYGLQRWYKNKIDDLEKKAGKEGATLWRLLNKSPLLQKEFVAFSSHYAPDVYSQFNQLYKADAKTTERFLPFAIALAVNHGQSASFYTVWGRNKRPDIIKTFQWFTNHADDMNLPLESAPLELLIHIADVPSLDIEAEGDWALAEYSKGSRKITGSYGHPPYRHLKGWLKKAGEENPKVKLYRTKKKEAQQYTKHTLPHNLLDGGVCFHKSYYGTRVLKYHGYASLWQAETNHAYVTGIYLAEDGKTYKTNIQHNYGRSGGKNYYQKRGMGQKTTSDAIKLAAALNKGRNSYLNATLAAKSFKSSTKEEQAKLELLSWAIDQNPDAWIVYHTLLDHIAGQASTKSWEKALPLIHKSGKVAKGNAYQKLLLKALTEGICNKDISLEKGRERLKIWESSAPRNLYVKTAIEMQLLSAHNQNDEAIAKAIKALNEPTTDKNVAEVAKQLRLCFGKGKKKQAKAKETFAMLYNALPHYCVAKNNSESSKEPAKATKAKGKKKGKKAKAPKAAPNRAMREVCSQYSQLLKKDKGSTKLRAQIQLTMKKMKKAAKANAIPKDAQGEVDDPAYQRWLEQL